MKPESLTRYDVRRELGRGGMGVVYEAYDAKARSIVALKTIESAFAESIYRLKHEFRALSDVHHPNLVRFGELACERGQWFFTMELVNGTDFVNYVRVTTATAPLAESGIITHRTLTERIDLDATDPVSVHRPRARGVTTDTLDERRLRSALAQLASALSAIHDAGQVHRDIKPSNVLVTPEGRVVVLDFGLIAAFAGHGSKAEELYTVGTPAFMSPEQVEGIAIGPESDWYSVGVMLFCALTCRLPFEGTMTQMFQAKLSEPAPAPRDFVPDVPADLDALCVALMQRDPKARPTGAAIRAQLGVRVEASSASHPVAGEGAPPFVGRGDELGALATALDDVRARGRGRRIVIDGEPGIGKSALVHAFLRPRGRELLVLSGRCYEQEDVPFKGVDTIVDAISEHLLTLPDREVEELVSGGVRYLASVFPVLNRVPIIQFASSRALATPIAVREQAFAELERLVDALARDRRVDIFLDDLLWAVRDSVAFLHRALWGAGRRACLFVATLRTGADLSPEIEELIADTDRIALGGLATRDARALLDALLSREHTPPADVSSDALVQEAAGHPLFLAELVRSVRAGQSARRAHAELEDVLWERIQGHDDVDRAFLEMVAVAGAPMAFGVLARAAGVDEGEIQKRLGSLRAEQLIRIGRRDGERVVEPYHDRLRESIVAHLETPTEAHARLGRALLASATDETMSRDVFAIVQHLNAARDRLDPAERARAAELNRVASDQCLRATAYARARDHARIGLALLGDTAWRDAYPVARDLHEQHMSAESYDGNTDAARDCFLQARAHVQAAEDRTALYVTWINLQTARRDLEGAMSAGRERLAELGITMPVTISKPMILARHLAIRAQIGRRTTGDLLHLPELRDPVHAGAIKVLVALVPAGFFLDPDIRAWLHMKIVRLSLAHGVSDESSYGFAGYGTLLAGRFESPDEGVAFGRLALALNERFKNPTFASKLPFLFGGFHAPWVQPFAEAKVMLRAAFDLAQKQGDTVYEAYIATVLSVVTYCESPTLAVVRATGDWAREIGKRRKDDDMAGAPEAHARYAAALSGETPSARDLGLDGSTDAELRGSLGDATPTAAFHYYFCNAELAYLAGDARRAEAMLEEARTRTRVIFGLPMTAELCFLESLVAARLHDDAPLPTRLRLRAETALRVHRMRAWARRCAANFEAPYLIARAELDRIGGDARAATATFDRATTAARVHHAPKREALALELASLHAARRGDTERAARLRVEAIDAYRRWGATRKAEELARAAGRS
jgi:predicted ATPase